jgi:hypothetical protein
MIEHSPASIRLWPLLALLALALFPFGWIGEIWPAFDTLLGDMFRTVLAHAIGHALIFTVVGLALLLTFPGLQARPLRFLALIVLAGIAQETFQLLYKQRPLEPDELRDLATDMVGGFLALAIVRSGAWLRRFRHM